MRTVFNCFTFSHYAVCQRISWINSPSGDSCPFQEIVANDWKTIPTCKPNCSQLLPSQDNPWCPECNSVPHKQTPLPGRDKSPVKHCWREWLATHSEYRGTLWWYTTNQDVCHPVCWTHLRYLHQVLWSSSTLFDPTWHKSSTKRGHKAI